MDESQQHMEDLQKVVKAGEANEDTYDEMKEYIQDFIKRAPKYDRNPEAMFKWCENLETHLLNNN